MSANSIKLLTGNSHPELAKLVADRYEKTSLSFSNTRGQYPAGF